MSEYLIGCDPELFVKNTRTGKFVSSHDLLPGTKLEPFPLDGGAVQVDGTAAEFNILPAATAQEFSDRIRSVLSAIQAMVNSRDNDLTLFVSPTAHYDPGYFKKLPQMAKLLGCDPDFNVYLNGGTGVNPKPKTKKPMRTGAGHIHVGWTKDMEVSDHAHVFDCIEMTKQLDAVLYPCSLFWDSDNERRELYGKIGTYRVKHYGVEYRPLSNAWIADPELHIWIHEATKLAAESLDEGVRVFETSKAKNLVDKIREDRPVNTVDLEDYYLFLLDEIGIPELPHRYIETTDK